ncbi:MAG: serine/threonine-protein kinase [Myxococcota bacterium]
MVPNARTSRGSKNVAPGDRFEAPTKAKTDLADARVHPRVDRVTLPPGTTVGEYEIIRLLGRGGMGAVYLARDPRLGRRVALKLLAYDDPDLVSRMIAEARSTARCHHDNIVVIYEVSEHEGMPYLALEYLEGETLASLLKRGTIAPHAACELMIPVAQALAHAHSRGIVHRDLKLENIFVTELGTVKVLDFGVAKAAGMQERASVSELEELDDDSNTQAGIVVGTLPYMAPEQLRGDPVDGRADLWALGVMLHELAVGTHPLGTFGKIDVLRLAATAGAMPNVAKLEQRVPARFALMLAKCWKERDERYASADELLADMQAFLGSRSAALGAGECPYPGLGTFERSHAGLYFGRKADVRRVQAKLRQHAVVAVSGPSGIGKSSLIYAGVLPALETNGEDWEVHAIRPGRSPLGAIETLLREFVQRDSDTDRMSYEPGFLGAVLRERHRTTGKRALIVVDQFEELFTLAQDTERELFLRALNGVADDAAGPLRVLLSIRSDYVHRALEHEAWGPSLVDGLVFLNPLNREALREALVEPSRAIGYEFESQTLIDRVLDDVTDCGGALPLLQFAASKLWDARDASRRVLTVSAYSALGGLGGALSSYADDVVTGLGPSGEAMAKAALVSLVTSERTRSVENADALCERASNPEAMRAVLRRLVDARLLISRGEGETRQIELVHESLIEQWERLSLWFDEQRNDVVFRRQLGSAASQWEERDRPDGLLWRGDALAEAERWLERGGEVAGVGAAFIERAREQHHAQTRRAKRARLGALVAGAVLVAVGFATLLAFNAAERGARASAEEARDQLERALSAEQSASDAARRAEQEAQQRFEAQERAVAARERVRQQDEDLQVANARLATALSDREAEAERAQAARRVAEAEAARAQDAERRSRALLEREAERVRRLEERLRNISTELR